MNWWEFLLVMMITLPIMVLWLGCIIDVIGRPDIGGVAKAAWMLFILFLPLVGAIAYVIMRPKYIAASADVDLSDVTFATGQPGTPNPGQEPRLYP